MSYDGREGNGGRVESDCASVRYLYPEGLLSLHCTVSGFNPSGVYSQHGFYVPGPEVAAAASV
jgi:hypothetical protein